MNNRSSVTGGGGVGKGFIPVLRMVCRETDKHTKDEDDDGGGGGDVVSGDGDGDDDADRQ